MMMETEPEPPELEELNEALRSQNQVSGVISFLSKDQIVSNI